MNASYLQPLEALQLRRTVSNASSRRQLSSNNGSQPHDPFYGLEEWDQEQNLIQLDTPTLSTYGHASAIDGHAISTNQLSSEVPNITVQQSLLDLQDPGVDSHTDPQLAGRLREQRESYGNAAPELGRPSSFSASSVISQKPDHLLCEHCETKGVSRSYCNVCDGIFCPKCWDVPVPHKRRRLGPGSVPHEKTDYLTAQKVKNALESHVTGDDQVKLHQKDEDTTWFGILREDSGFPSFQDYGRYASLMAEHSRSPIFLNGQWSGGKDSRYPSFVSFVGETGAGKSTVIKLIIDLYSMQEEENATPIVGCAGQDVPTSGDVHLYPDPQTFESDTPILYADCEGLKGGEREPIAMKLRKKAKTSDVNGLGSFEKRMQRVPYTSERDIIWADTNEKRSREFAVTHLYPRLLYTFSDVVVFVLKNPRVIEGVFEKLVTWAAAALEKSSNQPVLPHAIIVLNASENDIEPELWDVNVATDKLLHSLSDTVLQNPTFKKYARFWRERSRTITTVEELLLSYYSSIRVVRIPTVGRPNLISEQVGKLYNSVKTVCSSSQKRRLALRMLLDADELQHYLQYAFDHFAYNLDTPFDFVQASFVNSPIPSDFGGNILKLAISFMEAFPMMDGPTIFKKLSAMVASCIMMDSARHKIRGTAQQIFPQYLEHIHAALENFCDQHWPCEYIKPSGGARCVNVRSGHGTKGHQLKSGKVLAVGSYMSQFSFDNYRETFEFDIYSQLTESLKILHTRINDSSEYEVDAAPEVHKNTVMKDFYNHTAKAGGEAFISHSTCFSCLFEPPEHVLPCGHVLCTPCLRAYGRPKGKYVVEIEGCPIESLSNPRDRICKINMKPADAGIRVLTLDGGGIRGIAELEILRLIEQALGGRIDLRHFFDLIVGTSTGGFIALGLVAKQWSVESCTTQFEAFCSKAFVRGNGRGFAGLGFFVSRYNHSKYETMPLQEALIEAFGDDEVLFGGSGFLNGGDATNIKVGVVSMLATNSPVILTNYNRLCSEKLSYHFQRPEKLAAELKIWQAVRATSATPRLFKPYHHEPSKQVYLDGATHHNNPIEVAEKERRVLWPSAQMDCPDILVSVGTTYGPPQSHSELSSSSIQRGVLSYGKSPLKTAIDHVASALDSEETWNNYINILQHPREDLARFVRLNPQLEDDPPNLDDVECVQKLKHIVRKRMANDQRIQQLALRLVASCFYFERSAAAEIRPDGSYECRGQIHCRFMPDSEQMSELGRFLKQKIVTGHDHAFVIQQKYDGQYAESIRMGPDVIDRMIRQRRFTMGRINIRLSSKLAVTVISLSIKGSELFTISKFPRSLLEDEGITEKTRKIKTSTSLRWAGRTESRRRRQQQWTPPDLSRPPRRMLPNCSDEENMIGHSTINPLKRIANLFTNSTNQGKSPNSVSNEELDEALATKPAPVELDASYSLWELPDASCQRYEMEASSVE